MNAITNTTPTGVTRLDALATEARGYSTAIATNAMELGRVLTEAKALIGHGNWTDWVETNASMSTRSAENLMGIYHRFADRPAFDGMTQSKLLTLMMLPEGKDEEFVQTHDVESMTVRQLREEIAQLKEGQQAALDKAREEGKKQGQKDKKNHEAELQQQLQEANAARQKAEDELQKLNDDPLRVPPSVQDSLDSMKASYQQLWDQYQGLNDDLTDLQEQYDHSQEEVNTLRSTIARGDADRPAVTGLTLDVLRQAVIEFKTRCSSMPYMDDEFCAMPLSERNDYNRLLREMEDWCKASRMALNTFVVEEAAQ